MKKTLLLPLLLLLASGAAIAQNRTAEAHPDFKVITDTTLEPIAPGPFEATVESLSAYECPDWFRDAKFGMWAHWGPQCQPEDGDWYGRGMYQEGSGQYNYNIDTRDHPSRFGFKDWIHEWKAEKWDPDALVRLYKEAGARYFMTLANHHDNFDLYDSRYQSWNSVALGPQKDIVGGWAAACRKYGLPLGVSVHAAHSWTWYEVSRGSDTKGPLAGVPYDGVLTKEDGRGTWWEGLDPQDLYEQRHPLSRNNRSWDWEEDQVTPPDLAFCNRIYNRTVQLINDYQPDVIYFDDTYLPLWPVSDAGLKILAHAYNHSAAQHGGRPEIVVTGKVLTDWQKQTLVWDVERGAPDDIQPLPWQTCTCIGSWHYDKHIYYNDAYKTPAQVIGMLVDIVSKNGNLLLNIPLRADGTYDEKAAAFLDELEAWMTQNGESIFGTRPWVKFGEGPVAEKDIKINSQGFNEGQYNGMDSRDIRFNQTPKYLYVTAMGWPEDGRLVVKSLAKGNQDFKKSIFSAYLLGYGRVKARQTAEGLVVQLPKPCNKIAPVLRIAK